MSAYPRPYPVIVLFQRCMRRLSISSPKSQTMERKGRRELLGHQKATVRPTLSSFLGDSYLCQIKSPRKRVHFRFVLLRKHGCLISLTFCTVRTFFKGTNGTWTARTIRPLGFQASLCIFNLFTSKRCRQEKVSSFFSLHFVHFELI